MITGVRGGGYVAVPGDAVISMIRTLMPGETLGQARDELGRVVRSVNVPDGIEVGIGYTSPRDHPVGGTPCEISAGHPAVRALAGAVQRELGRPSSAASPPGPRSRSGYPHTPSRRPSPLTTATSR